MRRPARPTIVFEWPDGKAESFKVPYAMAQRIARVIASDTSTGVVRIIYKDVTLAVDWHGNLVVERTNDEAYLPIGYSVPANTTLGI